MEAILNLNKTKCNLECVLLKNFCDISTSSPELYQLPFWAERRCHAAKNRRLILNALGLPWSLPPAVFSFPMKIHAKLEFSDSFEYFLFTI